MSPVPPERQPGTAITPDREKQDKLSAQSLFELHLPSHFLQPPLQGCEEDTRREGFCARSKDE